MNGSRPTAASTTPASAEPRRAVGPVDPPGVGVAVSGGLDSLALLHVTWRVAQSLGLRVVALHVHHGLQPEADAWPGHIEAECRRWHEAEPGSRPVVCRWSRLAGAPARGQSVEEWARDGRREALVAMAHEEGLDLVLLAHHRRDQAETFLLQALRGGGPSGLAAMAPLQWHGGVCFARPWLGHSRPTLAAWVAAAGLRPVQDPSNADTRWARNRLRQGVWPALIDAFPQAEQALAEAARQCARALPTLEAGAWGDWQACVHPQADWPPGGGPLWVAVSAWQALSAPRRAMVLRSWARGVGLRRTSGRLIERVAEESARTTSARWPVPSGGELRWYRGRLSLHDAAATVRVRPPSGSRGAESGATEPPPVALVVAGPGVHALPDWGGTLRVRAAPSGAMGWADPESGGACTVRPRRGSDRFQVAPGAAIRGLKKQFQAQGIPAWARQAPVVCDAQGRLLFVPGLGLDARVALADGGWVFEWEVDPGLE